MAASDRGSPASRTLELVTLGAGGLARFFGLTTLVGLIGLANLVGDLGLSLWQWTTLAAVVLASVFARAAYSCLRLRDAAETTLAGYEQPPGGTTIVAPGVIATGNTFNRVGTAFQVDNTVHPPPEDE